MLEDALDVLSGYFDVLDVHFVLTNGVGTDGLEGASTDVEGNEIGGDMSCLQRVEHLGGEVQPCGGGGDGALVACVDGLIAFVVAADGFAVQVGWKWYDAGLVDDFGETDPAIPVEVDYPGVADRLSAVSIKSDGLAVDVYSARESAFFPLLVVANETGPCALTALLKGLGNCHLVWLEAEDLNGGACRFLEEETSVDDLGVVEHQ